MSRLLTVATRGTDLAIAQTRAVISELKRRHRDIEIRIEKITTEGDKDKRTALWELKSSGFFTSQLEEALTDGKADFAVHSYKDLPTHPQAGLTIAAVCDRRFPEDCLVCAEHIESVTQLGQGAKVGTSSLRRAVQFRRLRPDVEIVSVRGSVPTRLKRVEEGRFDAVILARAGMERLGLAERISLCFDPVGFIPAPAQGALAVQTRADDRQVNKLIAAIDDSRVRLLSAAERQVLATMQCGCHAPVGAFARTAGSDIIIDAFISDLKARNFIRRRVEGKPAEAMELAQNVADQLLSAGGSDILKDLERTA